MKIRTLGRIYRELGKRLAYGLKDEKEGKKTASIGILQPEDLAPGSLAKKQKKTNRGPI